MISVPTYPSGSIGVCVASKMRPVTTPLRTPSPELAAQLKYYTPEIHKAAFQLPAFTKKWFE
jgi:spermidine synthase